MKLLAFDTSSSTCSVALQMIEEGSDEARPHINQSYCHHQELKLKQAQHILPIIYDLMSKSDTTIHDLAAIAFGRGPGSYTGIRIASCVAQGLGYAANLPVIPISSLLALAQTAYNEKRWERVLVLVDARMEHVYWSCFEIDHAGLMQTVVSEQATKWEAVKVPTNWLVGDKKWYGVGDAWHVSRQILPNCCEFAVELSPSANAILRLAKEQFMIGKFVRAQEALPVYLR